MKRNLIKQVLITGAVLTGALFGSASWAATSAFSDTYNGANASGAASCGTSYNIAGVEPATTGKYPVFVYTVGTGETYNDTLTMQIVNAMAAKGYVAATVAYGSSSFGDCTAIKNKTSCIYNASTTASAISKLCSRAKADCSKGIVVGGLSQGSVVAIQAKNYDSRVQAAWGTGVSNKYSVYDLSSCMSNGNRALTSDRLRVVDGDVDTFAGGSQLAVQSAVTNVTGKTCAIGSTSCMNTNNSGWIIVRDSQVQDFSADHCYMLYGGCTGTITDNGFRTGTANWTMGPNLQWLTGFTTP